MMANECFNSTDVRILDFSHAHIEGFYYQHQEGRERETNTLSPFSSIPKHNGFVASKRDDLESIGFTLYYLLKREFPWSKCSSRHMETQGSEIKMEFLRTIQYQDACPGLKYYPEAVHGLPKSQQPNYEYLRQQLIWS